MGYSKAETIKKQKKLVSKAQRFSRKILVNLFKIILVLIITGMISGAGAGFGMMKGILDNAPDVESVNIVPKGYKSFIYNADGTISEELSTIETNRVYVNYEDIPKDYINAFVAIEDERFWTHNGIDVRGIFRAFYEGAKSGEFDQGASTLTQQLIKNNVFDGARGEKSFLDKLERKVQEQYLAMELEKRYSKEQIVEYYLNTIYLGRGVNGIQAASQKYFGKEMNELTISEIVTIAGITQNPTKYDPTLHPDENQKRRERVLNKMKELGYIDETMWQTCMDDNVYDRIDAEREIQEAEAHSYTYYTDALIDQVIADFMDLYGCTKEEASKLLLSGGYSIYSVQDPEIQKICDDVVNDTKYYGDGVRVGLDYALTIEVNGEIENYGTNHLIRYYKDTTGNMKYNTIYTNEDTARAAAEQFKEHILDTTGGTFYDERVTISPQPQFAVTLMDQKTGYVKAIVGGRGKKEGDRGWNRATKTKRQPGSCFKILAAYLPYIDGCGGSLASPFLDEEFHYANGTIVRNWWGASYKGYVSVRSAIAQSMNVIAVKAITEATPELAYEYLLKVGLTTIVDQKTGDDGLIYSDINQATALGGLTYGITNLEINAAYASIANGGVYTRPVFYSKIVDHDGNVVKDNTTPTTHVAMKPTTAWLLIDGMKSVISSGTGGSARMTTGIKCAGKTGTTSNTYDLYFCGMTPYYTASIWMGFDNNTNMGGYNQSTHTKMWRDMMDQIAILENQDPNLDFEKPEGITTVTVCQITGKYPNEGCPTFSDYCAKDSLPGGSCPGHETLEFCTESKLIATNACPSKKTLIAIVDEKTGAKKLVSPGSDDEDKDYTYTDQICPLHPEIVDEFTIKTSAGEGGTITPTTKVPKGGSVTIYITPYDGYKIDHIKVDGKDKGAKSSYTFSDVQSDHRISVKFKKKGGSKPDDPTTEKTTEKTTETTTEAPTTEAPTTEAPTTEAPTTEAPTTEASTTEAPVEGATVNKVANQKNNNSLYSVIYNRLMSKILRSYLGKFH